MDYQKKTVVASTTGLALEGMDVMFISFAMSMIVSDFNIDLAAGGLISTVTNWGMLVGGILFGILADKIGRVKVFTYTIFLFAIGTALTAAATNIQAVYIFRFIAGLGAGGEYGIGMALVTEAWPRKWRGRVSSYVSVGGQIGVILAAVISAIVLPTLGWRPLFLIGILPVILAFAIRWNMKESPGWLESKKRMEEHPEQRKQNPLFQLVATPGRLFTTLGVTIMAIVQIAGYNGLMVWLPSMLQKEHGLSVSGSALWTISTIVGMAIGMLVFGVIMDKIGTKVSFGAFLICSAVAVFLYAYASSSAALLIGGAIVGFFANGMYAGYGALIGNLYPSLMRSTATNTIFNLGRAIGGFSPVLIGYILEHYNMTMAMTYLSGLYILSFIVMLLVTMSNRNSEAAPQET